MEDKGPEGVFYKAFYLAPVKHVSRTEQHIIEWQDKDNTGYNISASLPSSSLIFLSVGLYVVFQTSVLCCIVTKPPSATKAMLPKKSPQTIYVISHRFSKDPCEHFSKLVPQQQDESKHVRYNSSKNNLYEGNRKPTRNQCCLLEEGVITTGVKSRHYAYPTIPLTSCCVLWHHTTQLGSKF